MTSNHQKSNKTQAQYHSFGEVLAAKQPYGIKSLSSVISAATPPFSASRLDMYFTKHLLHMELQQTQCPLISESAM